MRHVTACDMLVCFDCAVSECHRPVLSFFDDMLGLLSIAREHKPNKPRPFEILEMQAANPMDLAPGFAIFQHPITMEQSMFGW